MQRPYTPRNRGGGRGGSNFSPRNQSPQYQSPHGGEPYNPNSSFQFTPQQHYGGGNQGYNQQRHNSPYHVNNNRHQQNFNNSSGGKRNYQNSDSIEAYFKPSMLENPWAKLEEKLEREKESKSSS